MRHSFQSNDARLYRISFLLLRYWLFTFWNWLKLHSKVTSWQSNTGTVLRCESQYQLIFITNLKKLNSYLHCNCWYCCHWNCHWKCYYWSCHWNLGIIMSLTYYLKNSFYCGCHYIAFSFIYFPHDLLSPLFILKTSKCVSMSMDPKYFYHWVVTKSTLSLLMIFLSLSGLKHTSIVKLIAGDCVVSFLKYYTVFS